MGAVEKINTEMQKRPDDPYTEVIGHYIIDRCGLMRPANGRRQRRKRRWGAP